MRIGVGDQSSTFILSAVWKVRVDAGRDATIDLDVEQGEIVGLAGLVGSGLEDGDPVVTTNLSSVFDGAALRLEGALE